MISLDTETTGVDLYHGCTGFYREGLELTNLGASVRISVRGCRDVIGVLAILLAFVITCTLITLVKSIMSHGRVVLLLLLFVGEIIAQDRITPAQAVAMAARDLSTITVDRSDVRYFTTYNLKKDREDLTRTLSGHINGLSTESDIVKPYVVPGTNGIILRILLSDYGWDTKVWESLAKSEPYFHAFVQEEIEEEVNQPYGRFFDNQGNSFTEAGPGRKFVVTEHKLEKQTKVIRKFSSQAPWIAGTQAEQLATKYLVDNTQSECPLVRADWFLWQTALQADRTPGYYDFLGIKKQSDFEKLVGFNAAFNKETKEVELLEVTAPNETGGSGIAQQPRRIRRDRTNRHVGYWRTFDNKVATDQHNPLRVLDDNFKFDASEMFGSLPNNLWAYALFAANGDRQDSAPDFIGHDNTSRSNDGRIHVGLSCIRCHDPNGGLNNIDPYIRGLVQPPLALQSPFPEVIRLLRQQYLRDILGPMDDDRRTFSRALEEATGFQPKQYAQAYGQWFGDYDAGVTLERAAADMGVLPETFRAALDAQVRATGYTDTVLSTFLRPKGQQKTVGIRQWHESIPLAYLCLKAYGK